MVADFSEVLQCLSVCVCVRMDKTRNITIFVHCVYIMCVCCVYAQVSTMINMHTVSSILLKGLLIPCENKIPRFTHSHVHFNGHFNGPNQVAAVFPAG